MDLDKMSLGELKTIAALFSKKEEVHPYKIGKNYFIRTVTFNFTGKLTQVTEHELVLDECSWIADSGRFANALQKGTLDEVEPFPAGSVIIGRSALIDASEWNHSLPRDQK